MTACSSGFVANEIAAGCPGFLLNRLEKLWAMLEGHVARFGTYRASPGDAGAQQEAKQSGVLRLNCIDCLDRTNVVQGWLARKQLDALLASLRLLPPGSSITQAFPEVGFRPGA